MILVAISEDVTQRNKFGKYTSIEEFSLSKESI